MGVGAFLLGSAISNRPTETETSTKGGRDELTKYDEDLLREEIGSKQMTKLRKNEDDIIIVKHLPTGDKGKAMYSDGDYWAKLPEGSNDFTLKTTSKRKGLLGDIF